MNKISLMSFEDLAAVAYSKGRVVTFTRSLDISTTQYDNELKDFPVEGANWERLPEGTIIMASEDDNTSKTNKLTSSHIPTFTTTGTSTSLTGWFNVKAYCNDGSAGSGCMRSTSGANGVFSLGTAYGGRRSIECTAAASETTIDGINFNATHEHTYTNNSLQKLDTILKHPPLYIYKRVE